ncbi:putative lumazine-binding protein [Photorhabdus australis subsp. thailandensis]|uniref:Putative lumazine-binding protein n=1 Tax=Photorhabdus australis subsp. thailandensis TaxID=2805096 RepID=A0A1C0U283_9GAMM|nr:nuclear transport factor 2 family protein [Photorhabdus australis]OCQ52028.1 putative lumazine-binding protein [Photorhabdus australis subsp. thailandensis]
MHNPTYIQEYNAIVEVINKYKEGCEKANSDMMKPAFNEQATIFGVDDDNTLVGGPIQGLFDIIDDTFQPSPETKIVIVSIDIVGTAASARIDMDDLSGFHFTDFLHLLKVDGKWTIVSKIYHTHQNTSHSISQTSRYAELIDE